MNRLARWVFRYFVAPRIDHFECRVSGYPLLLPYETRVVFRA